MSASATVVSKQGAVTGAWICLILGIALMCWTLSSFILYLPLFLVSFILGIVAIAQRRILNGIMLLLLAIVAPLVIGYSLFTYRTYQALAPVEKSSNYSTKSQPIEVPSSSTINPFNSNTVLEFSSVDFDDIKALELLYGTYRPEVRAALWQGIALPKQLQADIKFPKGGLTKPALSQDFQEKEILKHIFLTATLPNEQYNTHCHGCAPLIGGAIFLKVNNKWQVERKFPYLMVNGTWGNPPQLAWKKIGKDRYALFSEAGYMAQGYISIWNEIWSVSDTNGPKELLAVRANANPEEDVDIVDITISMIESASDVWEAKVIITKKHHNSSPDITEQRYRYEGGKYKRYSSK